MTRTPWNRCDACGRFIAYDDFDRGAIRTMLTPDTAFTAETYRTLCVRCSGDWRAWRQREAERGQRDERRDFNFA